MAKKEKRDVLIPHKFLTIFETLVKQGKAAKASELTIAILRFDMYGEEPSFTDDGVAFVWESVIKPQLEENLQKYREVSKARTDAVNNRYKQKNTKDTNEYKSTENKQMNSFATDIDVDDDIDIDINKKEKPTKEKEGWEEIVKAYEQRFPMTLSSYKAQELQDIFDNYGKDAVLFAIKEARSGNAKKPIPYIRTVAMNYSRKEPEPMKESPEEIGERIRAETEKRRAEGKSVSMDEIKRRVREEMRRKGMTIVGESNTG